MNEIRAFRGRSWMEGNLRESRSGGDLGGRNELAGGVRLEEVEPYKADVLLSGGLRMRSFETKEGDESFVKPLVPVDQVNYSEDVSGWLKLVEKKVEKGAVRTERVENEEGLSGGEVWKNLLQELPSKKPEQLGAGREENLEVWFLSTLQEPDDAMRRGEQLQRFLGESLQGVSDRIPKRVQERLGLLYYVRCGGQLNGVSQEDDPNKFEQRLFESEPPERFNFRQKWLEGFSTELNVAEDGWKLLMECPSDLWLMRVELLSIQFVLMNGTMQTNTSGGWEGLRDGLLYQQSALWASSFLCEWAWIRAFREASLGLDCLEGVTDMFWQWRLEDFGVGPEEQEGGES